MSWKARDWSGCFVAALAAAAAGAVFGRMSGLGPGVLGEGWVKLGSLDFKEEPHCYYGVASFLPLLVLCGVLRLTLFKEFVGSRRQLAVMFPMLLGPALALGVTAALVAAALALGYPELLEDCGDGWSGTIRAAARGQLYDSNREITFIVVTTFVQGAVLGVVSGGWFVASSRPYSPDERSVCRSFLRRVSPGGVGEKGI